MTSQLTAAPVAPTSPPGRVRSTHLPWWRRRRAGDLCWAAVMIGPMAIGMMIFQIWPAIRTFYFSFTEWGPFGGYAWTGLDNYTRLVADSEVFGALRNTVVYTAIVLTSIPISVAVSALLNNPIRGTRFYRMIYFLPVVTMPTAIALVWRLIYNGDFGMINATLAVFGVRGPYWLSDPRTALLALGLVGIWMVLGHQIVILLAGLRGIPTALYEAAQLDGATRLSQFRHVTIPMLTPSIFFVTVITVLGSMQMFDLMFIMIGSDAPVLEHVRSIVYVFYEQGFVYNDKGYAATISVFLFIVILGLTAIQLRLQRRWVHYG